MLAVEWVGGAWWSWAEPARGRQTSGHLVPIQSLLAGAGRCAAACPTELQARGCVHLADDVVGPCRARSCSDGVGNPAATHSRPHPPPPTCLRCTHLTCTCAAYPPLLWPIMAIHPSRRHTPYWVTQRPPPFPGPNHIIPPLPATLPLAPRRRVRAGRRRPRAVLGASARLHVPAGPGLPRGPHRPQVGRRRGQRGTVVVVWCTGMQARKLGSERVTGWEQDVMWR